MISKEMMDHLPHMIEKVQQKRIIPELGVIKEEDQENSDAFSNYHRRFPSIKIEEATHNRSTIKSPSPRQFFDEREV